MFQTGFFFSSIIRSSKLHTQRQVSVRPLLPPAASLARLAAGRSVVLTLCVCVCVWSFVLLMKDVKTHLKHVERLTEINNV